MTQKNIKENNFDLDKESIKKIILKEIGVGQIFYPSDIANDYNLDLKMVIDVMSELKEIQAKPFNTEFSAFK